MYLTVFLSVHRDLFLMPKLSLAVAEFTVKPVENLTFYHKH